MEFCENCRFCIGRFVDSSSNFVKFEVLGVVLGVVMSSCRFQLDLSLQQMCSGSCLGTTIWLVAGARLKNNMLRRFPVSQNLKYKLPRSPRTFHTNSGTLDHCPSLEARATDSVSVVHETDSSTIKYSMESTPTRNVRCHESDARSIALPPSATRTYGS